VTLRSSMHNASNNGDSGMNLQARSKMQMHVTAGDYPRES